MVMPWFRKHKKILMVALIGFLMFTWGMLPALRHFATEAVERHGSIMDRPVTPQALHRAAGELELISSAGFMQRKPLIERFILVGDLEPEEEASEMRITGDAVWRYLMLTYMAEDAEIEVPEMLVREILQQFPPEMQNRTTYNAIKNWIAISELTDFTEHAYGPWNTDLWMKYVYNNHAVNAEFVKLPSEIFAPATEVTEKDVHDFYARHKEKRPDPEAGKFGYMAPERVKIEYAYPDPDIIKEQIKIPEDQILNYYEANLEEFVIEEKEDEEEEPAKEKDEENGEPDADTGEDESPDREEREDAGEMTLEDDGRDENDVGAEDPEPSYRPLVEVRDEIEKILIPKEAKRVAREIAESVMEALDALHARPGRPLNMQQIAGRYAGRGFRYELAETKDGAEYLAREEVEQVVRAGRSVARLVFDEEVDIGFPEKVDGPDVPVIFQVRDRKEPSPEPFERVKKQVEGDLLAVRSLEKATEFAETLKELARDKGMQAAAGEADRQLVETLGKPSLEKNNSEDERESGAEEEDPGNGEEKLYYLEVSESGFISLENPRIDGVRREDIVRKLLHAAKGEALVIKDTGRSPASFVIEKIDEKGADPEGFQTWLQRRSQMESQRQYLLMITAMQGHPLSPDYMSEPQKLLWQRLQSMQEKYPPPSAIQ